MVGEGVTKSQADRPLLLRGQGGEALASGRSLDFYLLGRCHCLEARLVGVGQEEPIGVWWSEGERQEDPWFCYANRGSALFVQPFDAADRVLKKILWSGIGPQETALKIARWRALRRVGKSV